MDRRKAEQEEIEVGRGAQINARRGRPAKAATSHTHVKISFAYLLLADGKAMFIQHFGHLVTKLQFLSVGLSVGHVAV